MSSVLLVIFRSTPNLIRIFLSLFWIYLTLNWRVRKTRKVFENQLLREGMSKYDAQRLSAQYEELKNSIIIGIKKSIKDDFNKDIGRVEDRVDRLVSDVQFKSTCVAMHGGVDKEFQNVNSKIDNVHEDVKEILRRMSN